MPKFFTNRLSPAKINLFLHILGQRADGYHELQTLFCLLNWGDSLNFEFDAQDAAHKTVSDSIEINGIEHVNLEENLIFKAYQLFSENTEISMPRMKVNIDKRIPMGGGLGGGSSNAATTLLALNDYFKAEHFGHHFTLEQLEQFGKALGADVPVFIGQEDAWAEGVGEKLTPIKMGKKFFILLLPQVFIDTTLIFKNPHLKRNTARIHQSLDHPKTNDCEPLVRNLFPLIDQIFELIQKVPLHLNQGTELHPLHLQLSGTGSSLFIECASKEEANIGFDQINTLLKEKNLQDKVNSVIAESLAD